MLVSVSQNTVFKEAWINTVKLSTVMNVFRYAGIWPVNSDGSTKQGATIYRLLQVSS